MKTPQVPAMAGMTQLGLPEKKKPTQRWKIWEEIDGCYIFPANADPDDLSFGRVKPVARIEDSDEALEFIRYLMRLPAFNPASKAMMRLQREHERQSNRQAVRDGSHIKGF